MLLGTHQNIMERICITIKVRKMTYASRIVSIIGKKQSLNYLLLTNYHRRGTSKYNVQDLNLKPQRSFYSRDFPKQYTRSDTLCKSDINVAGRKYYTASSLNNTDGLGHSDGEYYKKYEHDETPVREFSEDNYIPIKVSKASLTNSDLDKLEKKVFNNVSEELQTDENSKCSLESNIKFFKTTVQELFDNFYASMKDLELYKKRFHEILQKNQQECLDDMEAFIKDVIQHISDCESASTSNNSKSTEMFEITYDNNESSKTASPSNTSEEYNMLSPDKNLTRTCNSMHNEEIFNIILLSSDPCASINRNIRYLISDMNIKARKKDFCQKQIASADNLNRLASKKVELENYVRQRHEAKQSDVEIPVKVSYAKKNIHLDEDFIRKNADNKSFIIRICNFLCNKFRKSTLG